MRMGRMTSSICQALGLPCYYYYYSPSAGPEAVAVINVMAGLMFCSGHNSKTGRVFVPLRFARRAQPHCVSYL